MPLDKRRLFEFLEEVSPELKDRIVLVAVGGTAMTLLDAKESTIDVDFTGPREDIAAFRVALSKVPHGFQVDTWEDGVVFSQFLPGDYVDRSVPVEVLSRIDLRALHPVDVVATKAGRLDERDMQDIEACIHNFNLKGSQIAARAQQITYVGNRDNYDHNVRVILDRFFG